MLYKLKEIAKTNTVKQSIVTSVSVFISSGLGAVFYLILARQLGPHDYGLFALAIAIVGVTVSVSDLGITQGLVRFVGSNATNSKYFPYVKIAFEWKLIMGLVVGTVFGLGGNLLARHVFHQPDLGNLLPLVGIIVISQLLFFLATSVFQALQKFFQLGGLQIGVNIVRLVLLFPLLLSGRLYSSSAVIIFFLSYFAGFAASWIWLEKKWLQSTVTIIQKKEFWDFNRWTAVVAILSSLTGRIDILLTGRLLSLSEVGIYSLATTMVSFLPQLAAAIGTVTTAKFAGMREKNHELPYLRKSIFLVGGAGVLIAFAMIPVSLVVLKVTGRNYSASFVPFLILLFGQALFIITNPIRDSILYFHSKPKFIAMSNLLQAITIVLTGLWIIPIYGVIGSAMAVVTSFVVSGLTTIIYYSRLAKKTVNT